MEMTDDPKVEPLSICLNKSEFTGRAFFLGERLDVRSRPVGSLRVPGPAIVNLEQGGAAVVFRYGAVVLFDVDPARELEVVRSLLPIDRSIEREIDTEQIQIRVVPNTEERVEANTLWLRAIDGQRLQLVAIALSRSAALAHYEAAVTQHFERVEPFATDLDRQGIASRNAREILKHIGRTLLIEHKMTGRVEVTDKPELLWEHSELETLFARLADEFELRERDAALDRKLEVISRTAQTVLELQHHRRALRVEWYIVILIVIEIGLTVYDMFFR